MEARKKRQKLKNGFLVLGADQQADGSFNQGKIVEKKMIGFSGEGSFVKRVGPLYYWAWAKSDQPAIIPEHPHRGFEIISYVLSGEMIHSDSLGKKTHLKSGDLQVMHTGSGLEHEEQFWQPPVSMLQVWLDPNFKAEIKQPPHYQFASSQVMQQREEVEGWQRRSLAGGDALIELETPVIMEEWNMAAQKSYLWQRADHDLAALVISGQGTVMSNFDESAQLYQSGDFIVFEVDADGGLQFMPAAQTKLVVFEIAAQLSYALFPKP